MENLKKLMADSETFYKGSDVLELLKKAELQGTLNAIQGIRHDFAPQIVDAIMDEISEPSTLREYELTMYNNEVEIDSLTWDEEELCRHVSHAIDAYADDVELDMQRTADKAIADKAIEALKAEQE